MDLYPLFNSLRIAALSTVLIFFVGLWAAQVISRCHPVVKGVLDVVLTLPRVLPPTVVGYLLPVGAQRGSGERGGPLAGCASDHGVVCGGVFLGGGGLLPDVPHRPGGL